MISLACASVPPKAYLNVIDCLNTKRIGRGKYVQRLEESFSDYIGSRYCIAVANGTLADIIMLATLKEMFPGKTEVILPALTFIAQANAVKWAGLKPVFVDVDDDFQMQPAKVNENTLCLFPANLIGKEWKFQSEQRVPVLEDCCEAMGGQTAVGWEFGTLGIAGSFSMYPSHTITTGEGGLIVTDDGEFARIARSIHNHGKRFSDFDFDYVGINAKMTNLQAAIGCELIKTIDEVNRKRRRNVDIYNRILGLEFYASAPHCYPVFYKTMKERDNALRVLEDNKVEARKLMSCVPETVPFKEHGKDIEKFPNAQKFANCGLFLPVHQKLTKKDIEYVCKSLPGR